MMKVLIHLTATSYSILLMFPPCLELLQSMAGPGQSGATNSDSVAPHRRKRPVPVPEAPVRKETGVTCLAMVGGFIAGHDMCCLKGAPLSLLEILDFIML